MGNAVCLFWSLQLMRSASTAPGHPPNRRHVKGLRSQTHRRGNCLPGSGQSGSLPLWTEGNVQGRHRGAGMGSNKGLSSSDKALPSFHKFEDQILLATHVDLIVISNTLLFRVH